MLPASEIGVVGATEDDISLLWRNRGNARASVTDPKIAVDTLEAHAASPETCITPFRVKLAPPAKKKDDLNDQDDDHHHFEDKAPGLMEFVHHELI